MIDRIIELSIRHRSAVIACAVLLALAGVLAVYHTPMDAIPDVSENQIIVFADWPGHNPREIEGLVTYPLSSSLQGLPGARIVRSSSEFSFCSISVILHDGVDFYFARQQIGERLARSGEFLPAGVKAYLAPDGAATGQIFWYTLAGQGYDLARLRDMQDWYVRGQLAAVEGVAEVATVGGRVLEYQARIDPERLAQVGLTPGMVTRAIAEANTSVGGQAIEKAGAEYLVHGIGWLGARREDGPPRPSRQPSSASPEAELTHERVCHDLEQIVLRPADGEPLRLRDVAKVTVASAFRRGALEMHGNETVGGVVLMRYGENPLEVTRRVRAKISELSTGLPPGMRIVAGYDRTPLITGAVHTVTSALVEAIVTASLCVLLVLLHFRSSLVIVVTLPLAALTPFIALWLLRQAGIADVQTNIMSLAGIVVSIGVLVDSSIVMAENAMHTLHGHFGDRPVRGDVRRLILPACRLVGRPIFFSVAIMLISFLPVFCLGGIQGKMFRPLALTKSLAMLAAAVLSITLVPALATVFIRGRLREERQSWLVRSFADVYRPVLDYCLEHPLPLAWVLAATFLAACAPLGNEGLLLAVLFTFILLTGALSRTWRATLSCLLSLTVIALAAEASMRPLLWQKMPPLDEGLVMDMPITVPRASITQAADDLKARDMLLCRFPEVAMVMGKAGRAETPTDPAPLDMIETMVEFRPRERWPKRKLHEGDARRQTAAVLAALVEKNLVKPPVAADRDAFIDASTAAALVRFDGSMREFAFHRNGQFEDSLREKLARWLAESLLARLERQDVLVHAPSAVEQAQIAQELLAHADHHLAVSPELDDVTRLAGHAGHKVVALDLLKPDRSLFDDRRAGWQRVIDAVGDLLGKSPPTFFTRLAADVRAKYDAEWRRHVAELNVELFSRGTESYTRLAIEELLARVEPGDEKLSNYLAQVRRFRARPPPVHHHHRLAMHTMSAAPPDVAPQPQLKELQERLAARMRWRALLWRSRPQELAEAGGELDRALQMPGWANVWTRPIQNRVDMLFSGVNTDIGVRVLGRRSQDVSAAAEEIAAVLKDVPGSEYVMAEEVRGKGYLEIQVDRDKAAQIGVSLGEVNEVIETALGGTIATHTLEGRERHAVRVIFPGHWREDEEAMRRLPLRVHAKDATESDALTPATIPLAEVADIRITPGPASIKSENGLLRNYVRLNVRGRSATDFIAAARRAIAERVTLPPGVYLEWTGQFEHDERAKRTLLLVLPLVIGSIVLILYWTYRDLADALLMLLAVPGALAGGVLFQWLLGYDFSITVLVGYIACFGMATSTGIIMLVYLREAVAKRGGLGLMSLAELREAVMEGAVHRLRPKLLTEGTTILGLAPMLWASGVGAEVIKPMAAPVLGGILVADEVIDLLLPVMFYWVRRRRLQRERKEIKVRSAV